MIYGIITAGTLKLIGLVINVLLVCIIGSTPFAALILLMTLYDSYKKRKTKEDVKAERLIVKRNEIINETAISIKTLEDTMQKLEYENLKLEKQIRTNNELLGIENEPIEEVDDTELIEIDYNAMTIKELQDIARELKIKGFSRLSKDKLIAKLSS